MTKQAKQEWGGEKLYRWKLETSAGPKIAWAKSEGEAKTRAEQKGLKVYSIRPSASGEQ